MCIMKCYILIIVCLWFDDQECVRIHQTLRALQEKHDHILLEHDALMGHANKKQKIHYITTLKAQINELVEENRRLREA